MATITVPHDFTPRAHQLEFLKKAESSGLKRILLLWHRRSGKDAISFVYMIRRAVEKVGIYYYLFPDSEVAKKVVWNGMMDGGRRLLDLIPAEIIKKINRNDHTIELINGSIIYVIGNYEPDKFRGVVAHGVIISEYAYQKCGSTIWSDIFSPVISATGGWAIFNSTPNGPNHYYDLYKACVGNPAWLVSEVRNSTTKIVPEEEIEALVSSGQMTEEKSLQEYECEFTVRATGSIFGDMIQRARDERRIGQFEYDPNLPVDTYWDLGFKDATSVWFVQRQGTRYTLIDYYENSHKSINFYYDILEKKGFKYRFHFLPHDGVRHQAGLSETLTSKEQFDILINNLGGKRMGQTVISAKPFRKIDAVQGTRSMFHNFYFCEDKLNLAIRKLSLYRNTYNPRTKSFSTEALHDENSHAADAFMNIYLGKEAEVRQSHSWVRPPRKAVPYYKLV